MMTHLLFKVGNYIQAVTIFYDSYFYIPTLYPNPNPTTSTLSHRRFFSGTGKVGWLAWLVGMVGWLVGWTLTQVFQVKVLHQLNTQKVATFCDEKDQDLGGIREPPAGGVTGTPHAVGLVGIGYSRRKFYWLFKYQGSFNMTPTTKQCRWCFFREIPTKNAIEFVVFMYFF